MSDLNKAIVLAATAHAGQRDKGGRLYILHPMRLMKSFEREEEQIVALLHDVVEDSDTTVADLLSQGFSEDVVEAIRC